MISSRDGAGLRSSRASAFITMPGEQKPHWEAPAATKLSAHWVRRSAGRPSSVVTLLPATRAAGWAQETAAFPSTITVQAPQEQVQEALPVPHLHGGRPAVKRELHAPTAPCPSAGQFFSRLYSAPFSIASGDRRAGPVWTASGLILRPNGLRSS